MKSHQLCGRTVTKSAERCRRGAPSLACGCENGLGLGQGLLKVNREIQIGKSQIDQDVQVGSRVLGGTL